MGQPGVPDSAVFFVATARKEVNAYHPLSFNREAERPSGGHPLFAAHRRQRGGRCTCALFDRALNAFLRVHVHVSVLHRGLAGQASLRIRVRIIHMTTPSP